MLSRPRPCRLLCRRIIRNKITSAGTISSEGTSKGDKGKELPLPPTLGEHQMRYLGNWQSIRDVLEPKSDGHPRTNSHRPLGEIDTHLQQNLREHRTYNPPTNDPSAPSRFSQVARLKEYLKLNIKVLQDQIDWNSHKINSDKLLRDQGIERIERGTNTERDSLIEGAHEDETPFCFHCLTHGHKVYRCTKPGRERAIAWLHQQESIIDYCKKLKQKHQPTSCDVQRLDAIATTRRLTNPDGKDWQEKEILSHGKQHEISKDISQEAKRGMTINSSTQITPNSHFTQFDKFKTNTPRDESEKRSPGHDPQYTGQIHETKDLLFQVLISEYLSKHHNHIVK